MNKNAQKTKIYNSIIRNTIIAMVLVFIITMAAVGLSYAQDILLIDLVTISLFFSFLGGFFVGALTAIFTFLHKR